MILLARRFDNRFLLRDGMILPEVTVLKVV